jgi:hypothetical protein
VKAYFNDSWERDRVRRNTQMTKKEYDGKVIVTASSDHARGRTCQKDGKEKRENMDEKGNLLESGGEMEIGNTRETQGGEY